MGGIEPRAEALIVLSLEKPASQALTAEPRGAATPAWEGRAGGRGSRQPASEQEFSGFRAKTCEVRTPGHGLTRR